MDEMTAGGGGLPEEKEQYVTRQWYATCDKGTTDFKQYLNLPLDHGVYFQNEDMPLMNGTDHTSREHILHFGRCTSEANPENAIMSAPGMLAVGLFNPVAALAMFAVKELKHLLKSDGCKCIPMTLQSWKDVNDRNRLDGAPAILNSSQCLCAYGGTITIVEPEPPKEDENADDDESNPPPAPEEPYDPVSALPKSVQDKVLDMNSIVTEMNSMVESGEMQANCATSPAIESQNSAYNHTQTLPPGSYNSGGFITDSAALTNFNIGSTTVANMGTGVAANYNALRACGINSSFADVIDVTSSMQSVPGMINQGPMICNVTNMSATLGHYGLKSEVMGMGGFDFQTMKMGDVAMLASPTNICAGKTPSFQTLRCTEKGLMCLESPELTMDSILGARDINSTLVVSVKA